MLNKIKNVVRWLPIIWNDRDWDHSFLFKMLEFKLSNMYKAFTSSKAVTDWKYHDKDLKALKICIEILKRKDTDFYFNTFSYLLDHMYINFEETENEDFCEMRSNWESKEIEALYESKRDLGMKAEDDRTKLLFKLMGIHCESWWD